MCDATPDVTHLRLRLTSCGSVAGSAFVLFPHC